MIKLFNIMNIVISLIPNFDIKIVIVNLLIFLVIFVITFSK